MKGIVGAIKGVAFATCMVASFGYGVIVACRAYGHVWNDTKGEVHWESPTEAA